ncbi:PLDc N-terminal domain-containing protein [Roseobacter ponti]|uniref:PLDc_N domain-containing protein n=1 Tax=Roseobacter ponti TaxID=1891787 RepID=A0A858SX98_9RHOB|nr:PLD nuclease N-terminal domain-containing protein [Roseobacter ponti]QJF53335.1 PLDc_N domain-containing protein [Roseobacter ponti]
MEYAGFGGFILLVLNIWAIVSVIGSRASTGGKVIWVLLIIVLPLVGFIIWFFAGPRAASATV